MVCLVGELMDKISSKFIRFSESFITIKLIPTNHHGTHAIESLPFVCSQKPSQSGLQNFVLINPHNRVEQKKSGWTQSGEKKYRGFEGHFEFVIGHVILKAHLHMTSHTSIEFWFQTLAISLCMYIWFEWYRLTRWLKIKFTC